MSRQNGASSSLMAMDKRSKIMLGVLAGVVLIAALYFLVLKKSGSSDSNATGPVVKPSSTATVAPKASPTPKAAIATPATVVFADSTRDPFQPLPQETAAASPTAAPSSAPSTTPTSSSPAVATTHSVQLLSITGETASVSYDKGTAKTVKAGTAIAAGMTVVKIDASAVFVSYNDKLYAIAPGQTVSI